MQDDDAMPTDASDTAIDTELGEQLNYVLIGYDMANPFISRPSTTVVSDHLVSNNYQDISDIINLAIGRKYRFGNGRYWAKQCKI